MEEQDNTPSPTPDAPQVTPSAPRGSIRRRALRMVRAVVITIVVAFLVLAWTTRSSDPNPVVALRESRTVRSVLSLLRSVGSRLDGERDDRVNVLLVGIGGAGHEGPLLADTILIASVSPSTGHPTLISIPRDLLLPTTNGAEEKANAVYAYAEDADRAGGETLAAALEQTLGLRIPYYLRVDFAGFAGLIDDLGGVTVDVERTLDDPRYPITGKEDAPWEERFMHLVIPAGPQHMDGATALQYVRSRSAAGVEGSDFARARRQHRILRAVRDRIAERGGLTNPRSVIALLKAWRRNVHTNLDTSELLRLSEFVRDANPDAVTHVVFSAEEGGELIAGRDGRGAYVLRPRGESYAILAETVARAFNPATAPQRFTVAVWNGTTMDGLAVATAATLDPQQFIVTSVGNAPRRTVAKTIVYYERGSGVGGRGSDQSIQQAAEGLAAQLGAVTSTTFPALDVLAAHPPDILIVLGASAEHVRAADGEPPS